MALVTLRISFRGSRGTDEAAELVWVADNGNGAETRYSQILNGATITQETFPGHCWLLRGVTSGQVLGRMVAQDRPAVQEHVIDANEMRHASHGPETRTRRIDPDGVTPSEDSSFEDDSPLLTGGVWVSTEDESLRHRFERIPSKNSELIRWVEKDAAGTEIGQLIQVDARVDTRWLWWCNTIFKKWRGMDYGQEQLLVSALTVAAAYKLDEVRVPFHGL